MSTGNYSYFDEAYFQDGTQRGTAYANYKEGARDSQTFREIAHAIKEAFEPRRVLDVGCATGTIVRWLNELGCEAHGVDVSDWAVRNAEHKNVRHASADNLPYPDRFFDLVISCHSLEHLPSAVYERSLVEICRVNSAFQFHLLPMIGTPPYDGEPEFTREQLRKDPTHQQLHDKEFWVERFNSLGWREIQTGLLFNFDTSTVELSVGQLLLKRHNTTDDSEVLRRTKIRNQQIFRMVQLDRTAQQVIHASNSSAGHLDLQNDIWRDVERRLGPGETISLVGRSLRLIVIVEGTGCYLRLAVGQDAPEMDYAHAAEYPMTVQPGCHVFNFSTNQFRTLRGRPDLSFINHLALGGSGENARVSFFLCDQDGNALLT